MVHFLTWYAAKIIRGPFSDRPTANVAHDTMFIDEDTHQFYFWDDMMDQWMEHHAAATDLGIAKYVVYQSGGVYKARENVTAEVKFENANPTLVIQYALDNLTAGRTWKQAIKLTGEFTISTITIPSYTTLDLTNAKLTLASSTNSYMLVNKDTTVGNTDIEIFGGVFDGNKAAQTSSDPDLCSMIYFKKCRRIVISHCTLTNAKWHSARFRDCYGPVLFTNNISLNPASGHTSCDARGQAAGTCRNHFFVSNYFENTTATVGDGDTFMGTLNVSDSMMVNNTCERVTSAGGKSSITPSGLRNIVANNTINNGDGPAIAIAQSGTSSEYDASGSIISGNIISNHVGYAISGLGLACKDVQIKNNTIDGGTVSANAGIRLSTYSNSIISENIVSNCFHSGIIVQGTTAIPAKYMRVVNNICYNNGKGLSASNQQCAGIAIHSTNALGDISLVDVMGNTCFDNQGTKTQKYGIALMSCSDCTILNNRVQNNLTSGILQTTDSGSMISSNRGHNYTEAGKLLRFDVVTNSVAAPTVQYRGFSGNFANATESNATITLDYNCIFRRMRIKPLSNTRTGSSVVFTFRDDGADVPGSSVPIAAGSIVEGDTGPLSVPIAAGSKICFKIDATGASGGGWEVTGTAILEVA